MIGATLRRADGESGTVEAIEFAATPQVMYNMTVADAHTYTVGDGEWVVHNSCWTSNVRRGLSPVENAFEHWKKHRADFPNMNNALEYLNETRKFLSDPPSAALIDLFPINFYPKHAR